MRTFSLILLVLSFHNCMTLNSNDIKRESLKFSTNEKKSVVFSLKKGSEYNRCATAIDNNFNYSSLFNISDSRDFNKDFFVSYGCEHKEEVNPVWGLGFLFTLGFFPVKVEMRDTVSMSFYHKRISPKPYVRTITKSYYISWFFIPVQIVQLILKSDNDEDIATFTKNVSDRIYYEIPQIEAEIAKKETEEENERVKREAEEESEREKKKKATKEREKKAEAEIAEKKAKAKKITIPKGGFYCTNSGFAMGLAVDPSRKNFRELELIKGCFEADRPIKAKISDLGDNTNIVIVYIGNDEFFSTERLLGLKKRI